MVIVGDSGVGKTSLLLRYVDDVFTETFIATIGVDFKIKTFEIDGQTVKLQIWDTAGQDRFRNIVSTFYRGAHAILLVYDVTDMTSFHSVTQWRTEIERYAREDAQQVLVGNKSDLVGRRQVPLEEADALAQRLHMRHVETSAKTTHNLRALFEDVTRSLMITELSRPRSSPEPSNPIITPSPSLGHAVKSGGICNC